MPEHPFEYQVPTPEQAEALKRARVALKTAYEVMLENVPECAERTLAVRKLEEASMWANKAIVFGGEGHP